MEQCFDVMDVWQNKASRLSGRALDAGHYLAEEQPEAYGHGAARFPQMTNILQFRSAHVNAELVD